MSLKNLAIVVPPVKLSRKVAAAKAPVENQPTTGPVVTDQLVTPKRVESKIVTTAGFQTLGLTWPEQAKVAGLGGQVRARTGGNWSNWVDLEPSDDAPDAGTADAARAVRGGTDPVSIGNADAVQLAFTASEKGGPAGLSLALIGSAEKPASANVVGTSSVGLKTGGGAAIQSAVFSTALVQAIAAPSIITRAQWGAPAQACTPDVASRLVGAVVHHTAGANTYSNVAQAMQQIRNDANYHINALGWCDIGYNFVVDKWGNIYEGRANSMTRAVVGAHAGGFNSGTVGVAMLGTYDAAPSAAMQQGVAWIIGWRLGDYGVDPRGSMTYSTGDGGVGARFRNQTVTLPRVIGHRDVWFTACPGDGGYSALPYIRTRASQLLGPNKVSPFGHVDSVTAGALTVTAAGWAIDPDSPSAPIMVQMYIDGRANSLTWANTSRPDVATAYPAPAPNNHGFTMTMATTPGAHTVCLYAINTGPGISQQLGCNTVNTVNNPFGHVDSVTAGLHTVAAAGWAIDPDTPRTPIYLQMYVDYRTNALTWANLARPDVGRVYPTAGPTHGFTMTMTTTPGKHTVCLYAINTGPGVSSQLSCHTVNVP